MNSTRTSRPGPSRSRRVAMLATGATALAALLAPNASATATTTAAPTPSAAATGPKEGARSSTAAHPGPVLDVQQAARAQVDECFTSIGGPSPEPKDGACPSGSQPKINGAYVWSAARSGDYAYFGTLSNVTCNASSTYSGDTTPYLVKNADVCEFGKGASAGELGEIYGDARTPQVLRVNADTQKVEDLTPASDPLLKRTVGLRGAAAHEDVVFLFGQLVNEGQAVGQGLSMFAFEGSTGKFLGSKAYTDLVSARGGVVAADGNLYLAGRAPGVNGGRVLRWTGDKEAPFSFEVVAQLANDPGYLTTFKDRLVASGWGTQVPGERGAVSGGPAKVWMSPPIPSAGLTFDGAAAWQPIFSWDEYDPDPVLSKGVAWGALTEWRGELYVGSYNQAAVGAVQTMWQAYGQPKGDVLRKRDMLSASRPTTVFRISDPGTERQRTTLLYGEEKLPVYNPNTKRWTAKANLLGQKPKFGPSGFNGNVGNAYAWTFTVFQDRLYMATFDSTGLITPGAHFTAVNNGLSRTTKRSLESVVGPSLKATLGGGDVWRMDDPARPAVPETLDGFGNRSQHGVRVFLPFEDKGLLYAGMASSWNLRATAKDRGGWELNRLVRGEGRGRLDASLPPDARDAARSAGVAAPQP
ncbi:hypothetical protein ACH4E8_29980 [Streptomyces sp. NPDC017979]|uniref:hypothetical protein n=1 Tax=Streptomyces sp. NPDC017979 TaxID=3365024 RepID=UPI0037B4607B